MATVRAELTEDRTAYVLMVQEEHQAMVRLADKKREERMAPLFRALGIPLDGRQVTFTEDRTALQYEGPDEPAPPQPDAGS